MPDLESTAIVRYEIVVFVLERKLEIWNQKKNRDISRVCTVHGPHHGAIC